MYVLMINYVYCYTQYLKEMGHAINTVFIISLNFTGMVTYAHLQAILWMGTKFINSNVSTYIFTHSSGCSEPIIVSMQPLPLYTCKDM